MPQSREIQWTVEDIYNALMAEIEPELCTAQLPYLDEMYEGETEQQHAKRAERYAAAFEMCEDRMIKFFALLRTDVARIRRMVLEGKRAPSEKAERTQVEDIERSFGDA